ncbi:hypothetical protein BDP67DRAFT_184842 [Colletotrichum lupini]|nr:hypothetical protein BDP67DRAFT_184842 [Colletotrichum lupini]
MCVFGFVVVLSRGFAVEISRTEGFVRRGPLSLEVSQIVNRPLGKVQIRTCRKWFAVRDPRWMKRLWCFSAAAGLHEPHLNPHLHSAGCCAPREQQHPSLALLRTSPQCPLPRGTRGRACGAPVGSDSSPANWPSFHPFQPPKPRSLPPLAHHQPCAVENRVNDAAAAQQAADRHPRPHVRANGNRLNRTGKTADREREGTGRSKPGGVISCISVSVTGGAGAAGLPFPYCLIPSFLPTLILFWFLCSNISSTRCTSKVLAKEPSFLHTTHTTLSLLSGCRYPCTGRFCQSSAAGCLLLA